MESLFCKVVSLSWGAGWMVLALLALRLIFRQAPRWLLCALWGLVALGLICPVTLTSPFALLPDGLAEPPAAGWTTEALPQATWDADAQPVDHRAVESIPAGDTIPGGDSIPAGGETSAGNPARAVPRPGLVTVLSWIWLAGTAAMVLYALVSLLRLRRRMATATRLAGNLKQSEQVGSPFVLGLFRPTIYLPYRIEPGDLAQVVAHERAHLARGDHWWKALGFALLSVYWFHPLLWVAYHLFCQDMEAACDQRVIRGMDRAGRQAYASALLRCSTKPPCASPCPLAFGELRVRDRVKEVMEHRPAALWVTVLAGAAGLIAAVCLLTRPVPAQDTLELTGSWDNDRVTYTLTLGSQVDRGVLYAEQWTDGVCVRSAPLPLTPETRELHIRMDLYGENGARTGTDIQIDTDQQDAALVTRFPMPSGETAVGWARNIQEENQSIPVTAGQEVILVSQVLDTGDGVHAYDCQTYLTEPQRLAESRGTILIRACFGEDPYAVPASPSSAAPVTVSLALPQNSEVPEVVVGFAVDYVEDVVAHCQESWPIIGDPADPPRLTAAKVVELTKVDTGTEGLQEGRQLWRLAYRLQVEGNLKSVVNGGRGVEAGWITESTSAGRPYLLVRWTEEEGGTRWQLAGVITDEDIQSCHTPTLLKRYGDMYTAATMELFPTGPID